MSSKLLVFSAYIEVNCADELGEVCTKGEVVCFTVKSTSSDFPQDTATVRFDFLVSTFSFNTIERITSVTTLHKIRLRNKVDIVGYFRCCGHQGEAMRICSFHVLLFSKLNERNMRIV